LETILKDGVRVHITNDRFAVGTGPSLRAKGYGRKRPKAVVGYVNPAPFIQEYCTESCGLSDET
jgi:hypothetical protein